MIHRPLYYCSHSNNFHVLYMDDLRAMQTLEKKLHGSSNFSSTGGAAPPILSYLPVMFCSHRTPRMILHRHFRATLLGCFAYTIHCAGPSSNRRHATAIYRSQRYNINARRYNKVILCVHSIVSCQCATRGHVVFNTAQSK